MAFALSLLVEARGDEPLKDGSGPASYLNVAYATFSNSEKLFSNSEKLDLFVPDGLPPYPLVVVFHGGGYIWGNKDSLDPSIKSSLLSAGYAVASVDYRLSTEALFPAALLDAKAAIRFLRASSAQYGLDPDRIAGFGDSAGGNLAGMLGVTGDMLELDAPELGNFGTSSRVQAVVDWFGPTDFSRIIEEAHEDGCIDYGSPRWIYYYLGTADLSAPAFGRANIMNYLSSKAPPFLVEHGTADCVVPVDQSRLLVKALTDSKVTVEYHEIVGANHEGAEFRADKNMAIVIAFLNRYLKSNSEKHDENASTDAPRRR